MGPSRRASNNGRSPLVNQQRQITSFFSKKTSSSSPSSSSSPAATTPLPSPSLTKQKPTTDIDSSPSPPTPSPLETKRNKPLLLIPPSSPSPPPNSFKQSYGLEVVDKRIRVYWPFDKSWYEGCVKHFDKISGKHLVQYDDADEELLNLAAENIEWPGNEPVKKFRRLRRISIVEDDEEIEGLEKEGNLESGEDDDSADEDWGKNVEKDGAEDVYEHMELEDEADDGVCTTKTGGKTKKRKMRGTGKQPSSSSTKKRKSIGDTKQTVPFDVNEHKLIELAPNNVDGK